MKELFGKLRQNHLLMMVVCCVVPLAVVAAAVSLFGASRNYLVWTILLLCPIMHFWMMKDMHGHGAKEDASESTGKDGKKGGCH